MASLTKDMIIQDDMDSYYSKIDFLKYSGPENIGKLHNYQVNNKTIKLLVLYHFSNKFKSNMIDYYETVSKLLFKNIL